MTFQALFPGTKPVIGMLHLKSGDGQSQMDRARREIDIYVKNGMEALLVENYFGSVLDCECVLDYLQSQNFPILYGVNILGDYVRAFEMSKAYAARLIQIDSVCGHLPPDGDEPYAERLKALKQDCDAVVLGGVRFKYQPIRSGRSLKEDLILGAERCDGIVVTGDGTGLATPLEKIRAFRRELGYFPLIVGAGVTLASLKDSLALADGLIVGSWFKEQHADHGDVCPQYVQQFMEQKRRYTEAAKSFKEV